jgi:O-succinylbenzoic acid--CoA ligase
MFTSGRPRTWVAVWPQWLARVAPGWQAGAVRELVAIDLPGGPAFEAAIRSVWDAGDAIIPIDQRLPRQTQMSLIDQAQPHAIIGPAADDRVPLEYGGPLVEESDALVIATSGSTGPPKLLVHTDESLASHAWAVQARLEIDTKTDRWLACLPLGHLGGLGVLIRAIVTDTPMDILDGFDAERVEAAPTELGSTLVSLVPTALGRLDAGGYRKVVLGGAADPFARPRNIVRTYGLTETGGGVVYDGYPLDGVQVRIRDDGTIVIRGRVLARGLRQPDGDTVPIVDADGWFDTGDLGHWSGYSELVVDGRAEDLIVTGGENVWPGPVEAALLSHPGVLEVTVVRRPDPEWGDRVVAVVVPKNPGWPPSLDELRDHVKVLLPAYAAPKELVVVESLPRTSLGKVRRPRFDDAEPETPHEGRRARGLGG